MPEIEHLAARTSERVVKAQPKRVLVGVRGGCSLDTQLCQAFESSLRGALTNSISGIQFVNQEDLLQKLKQNGFLSIDAYDESLMRGVASRMDADIVVLCNLLWEPHGYELSSKIVNVSGDKELSVFKVKIARSGQGSDDQPVLIRDTESSVSLIIPRKNATPYYPACLKCPNPDYPEDARKKGLEGVMVFFVTISDQGIAEQITLVKSFDASLTANAIQTIRSWRFKPAIGPDGKPFAARMPLEVTYRLLR